MKLAQDPIPRQTQEENNRNVQQKICEEPQNTKKLKTQFIVVVFFSQKRQQYHQGYSEYTNLEGF